MKSGHVATGVATQIEPDFPRRRSDSVLAWRLGAEARDQLLHPGLAALRALWRPVLQAVVFADRNAHLKMLAARLALELVDSHDFPPPISAPTGNTRSPYSGVALAGLLEVGAKFLRAPRLAELVQCPGLDLPDALAGHTQTLADLLERPFLVVEEPEAQLEYASFVWGEGFDCLLDIGAGHGE